jgi:hypothetical protein
MTGLLLAACIGISGLAGWFGVTESSAQSGLGGTDSLQVRESVLVHAGSQTQPTKDLQTLHRECREAGEHLRRDVAAMVPGRTWTWQLDAERSRAQLDALRSDLKAFWYAEAAFEASLSAEQKSMLNSQFVVIQELFQHLEGNAESLDTELRKSYPTRWHVANDVSDMQKEINRWRKLHRRIAGALGLDS